MAVSIICYNCKASRAYRLNRPSFLPTSCKYLPAGNCIAKKLPSVKQNGMVSKLSALLLSILCFTTTFAQQKGLLPHASTAPKHGCVYGRRRPLEYDLSTGGHGIPPDNTCRAGDQPTHFSDGKTIAFLGQYEVLPMCI
jgi:hypothetical protein